MTNASPSPPPGQNTLFGVRQTPKKRQRGVALLDAMISVFVAATVTFAGISMALAATQSAEAARQSNLGYGAARQILENMRGGDVTGIVAGANLPAVQYGPVPQLRELPLASASVFVAVVSDTGGTTYSKNVTARVTWRPAGGGIKTRTLSTRISPNGVGH